MALEEDPFAPPAPKERPLESFSIHELRERMDALQEEIDRCRRLVEAKQASKSAADAVFGR